LLRKRREPSKYERKFKGKKPLRSRFPALELQPLTVLTLLIVTIFFAGGGPYFFFEASIPAIAFHGRVYPLIPHELAIQTMSESILAMIFLASGVGGAYMGWSGLQSRLGHRPSIVKTVVGMILLTMSAASIYLLFMVKFA